MRLRLHALFAPCALLAACSPAVWSNYDLAFDGSGEVVEGEFAISADLSEASLHDLGLEQLDWNDAIAFGLYRASDPIPVEALQAALSQASRGGLVVEANRPAHAYAVNDPYYEYQWNFQQLRMEEAWTRATGAGVVVAVVDTGVSSQGEDTPRLRSGWDFVDDDSSPEDQEGHGTHVAGTIAQATNNGVGCAGMAPDAEILPVRVLGAGGGDTWTVARGITWATDQGADVINLSLGSAWSAEVTREAVQYAADAGVVVVAASGNEYQPTVSYPAAYPEVIAVGASDAGQRVADFSNGGTGLDVVAPGTDILQEYVDASQKGYVYLDGTSMASPHVAGLAALLLSAGAPAAEVRDVITATARDLGASGWDERSGWGLIDPVAALDAVGGSVTPPTPPSPPDAVDTVPPEISAVDSSRSGDLLVLTWHTDEPATSEVSFEGFGRYGDADTLGLDHELRFRIDPAQTYVFELIGVDAAGNEGRSGALTSAP